MTKIFFLLLIAVLSLGGCTRHGVDSEVKSDEPSNVDAPNPNKGDSANKTMPADSTGDQRPDSINQHH